LSIDDIDELSEKLDVAVGAAVPTAEAPADAAAGSSPRKKRRLKCQFVRLSNNTLGPAIPNLGPALAEVIVDPASGLRCLDLSFNCLERLGDAMGPLPELSVLYLHANKISKFGEVKSLGALLPKLRSLTLHGNPIEDKPHYRTYVIHAIPSLNQLDFSPVTKEDRMRAKTWASIYRKKLKEKSGAGAEEA